MQLRLSLLLFLFYLFLAPAIHAQEGCYDCNYDSLAKVLPLKKTDAERAQLLTLMIDLRPGIFSDQESVQKDFFKYIDQLIALEDKVKSLDVTPYKLEREAAIHGVNKNYEGQLLAIKKAIEIFDSHHKTIVPLLSSVRIIFNNLNQPEERFNFYKQKLDHYLVNGPVENTAACYHGIAGYYTFKADNNQAISNYLRAAEIFKKFSRNQYRNDIDVIAAKYLEWGNLEKARHYFDLALQLAKEKGTTASPFVLIALSEMSLRQKNYERAQEYADEVLKQSKNVPVNRFVAIANLKKAMIFLESGRSYDVAPALFKAKHLSDSLYSQIYTPQGDFEMDYGLYKYNNSIGDYHTAEISLLAAYQKAIKEKLSRLQLKYLRELSSFYGKRKKGELAEKYLAQYFVLNDAIEVQQGKFHIAQYENEQKELEQNERINSLKREKEIQQFKIDQRNKYLWAGLVFFALIASLSVFLFIQLRANKKTLRSLRKTQKQLILSEKMASLGELTAGIAHEIQNPLNFINNFSEVSAELADEMQGELKSGNKEEAVSIANNIKQNLEKIVHHGKRADSIVKGMLQHSRSSSGQKELTDLNALSDEYLRLSYHGLRAKDKSFNAEMQTSFDNMLPKVNIVSQDMGRVILNLFTNAFYSVHEKSKNAKEGYVPIVSVTTKKIENKIEIRIKDNGNGIPQNLLNKIYQPFFTTKPTGDGTGLGLSLSYDIVTKGHGGELKVETKEGEYAEFIITLPAATIVEKPTDIFKDTNKK